MPQITCPHCRQPYEIPPEQWPQYQGQRIDCTRCNQPFDVIGATVAPAMPSQAQPGAAPLEYASEPKRGMSGWMIALLVCGVVLIGVLATVPIQFSGRSHPAKIAVAQHDISTITAALELFESDNGRFPTTAEGLAALRVRPADGKSWHGPYLAHDAGNDPWGNPYVYRYPGTHNPYSLDVFSMGPDGREGGGDDVGNW